LLIDSGSAAGASSSACWACLLLLLGITGAGGTGIVALALFGTMRESGQAVRECMAETVGRLRWV